MGDAYLVASGEQWMRDRHMPLTAGEKRVLGLLLAGERESQANNYEPTGDYPDDELTFCHPGGWYLGVHRQSGAICRSLTRRAYVGTTDRYDADYQTWTLNEDGRNAATAAEKKP
jgi:acetyl esterase/lipase